MSDTLSVVYSAQDIFGSNPWISNPTGSGPTGTFTFNPQYFATPATAAIISGMLGGSVVGVDFMSQTPGNPFSQNQLNEMVELTIDAKGNFGLVDLQVNAGLVAEFFTHSYQLSTVLQMIHNEITNIVKEILQALFALPSPPELDPTVQITVNSPPLPTSPVNPPALGIGSFKGTIPLNDPNPTAWNMVTQNSLSAKSLDGKTNLQSNIPSPDGRVYLASVTVSNYVFGTSITGRWTLVGGA